MRTARAHGILHLEASTVAAPVSALLNGVRPWRCFAQTSRPSPPARAGRAFAAVRGTLLDDAPFVEIAAVVPLLDASLEARHRPSRCRDGRACRFE